METSPGYRFFAPGARAVWPGKAFGVLSARADRGGEIALEAVVAGANGLVFEGSHDQAPMMLTRHRANMQPSVAIVKAMQPLEFPDFNRL